MTVEAILQAAAELFCRIGYDHSSTNRIAERAGVSIGSLYQYFANKEAILASLLEEHHRAVHAVVDDALAAFDDPEVPLRWAIESLMRALVDLHALDPELNRVLSEEVPHLAHGSVGGDEVDRYAALVEEVLRRRPDVAKDNLKLRSIVLVTAVEALTRWLAHGSSATVEPAKLVAEAAAMLAGALTGVAESRSS